MVSKVLVLLALALNLTRDLLSRCIIATSFETAVTDNNFDNIATMNAMNRTAKYLAQSVTPTEAFARRRTKENLLITDGYVVHVTLIKQKSLMVMTRSAKLLAHA